MLQYIDIDYHEIRVSYSPEALWDEVDGMSFRQTIARYVGDHAETSDVHTDESLQTHYYKTTGEKGLNVLENLFLNNFKYYINACSKYRGVIRSTMIHGKQHI